MAGAATARGWFLLALGLALAACTHRNAVEEGATLYRAHGCAVCHGDAGRGDGTAAAALARRPRDFRDPAALGRGDTIAAIAQSIAAGGAGGATGMPAFAHIPANDRERMAAFIRATRQGIR